MPTFATREDFIVPRATEGMKASARYVTHLQRERASMSAASTASCQQPVKHVNSE
jgi:hypothetical protein